MTWLLILFGVGIVVSPLMWFRQSPRQKLITELRRSANSMGLQVSLHRRPDAREDETRLESVCYRLPWLDDSCRQNWVLHRYSNRGWQSDTLSGAAINSAGWKWTIAEADPQWGHLLEETVADIPAGVSAIIANNTGIGFIWNERDDSSDLQKVAQNLKKLQQTAKKFAYEA
ncbi:MAG: hypothetical protein P8H31_02630 [Porticoccaceae bacterium]|nr:hypothetical protein [Porticoccaceae bacterium]